MPQGRAWAPIDTLRLTHAYIVPSRFEPIRNGRIELIGNGYYGSGGRRLYGFVWADSAWRVRWSSDVQSYVVWPTITPPERQMLVWKTTNPVDSAYHYFSYIVTADVVGDTLTPPDTIARVDAASLVYMGGSWGRRRWVAIRDGSGLPGSTFFLYRSDSSGSWTQMRTSDLTATHDIELAPLSSTDVLVVTSEFDASIGWGILRDTVWTTAATKIAERGDAGTSLVQQLDGRLRLAWASYDDFLRSRVFANSAWAEPETIRAALPDSVQHLFYGASLSAEGSVHPALAWYGYKIRDDVAWYVWVSFPTDSGFGVGERLPGSWNGHSPRCLVDENGDVWVSWWRDWDGLYWTHSFCTATPSAPTVGEEAGRPQLRWSLTEPAPGTWWAVLRSTDGGPTEPVARIRAGAGVEMTWSDSMAPTGVVLRYSIRRECRDARFRITSAEAEWRPRGAAIGLVIRSENPAGTSVRFELSGASAGTVEVLLYDLFGRQVAKRRENASGSGADRFELPLAGRIRPGLYLLRVRGSDDRLSHAAKVVVIR